MNKMFKFNGMPYKRSGRAGGKSVSMIGMLVLLLAALLVLPSCFDDDDDETTMMTPPTDLMCEAGMEPNAAGDMCVLVATPAKYCGADTTLNEETNKCEINDDVRYECGADTTLNEETNKCEINDDVRYETVREGTTAMDPHMAGDDDDMVKGTAEADFIEGGKGKDIIKGMAGNDTIDGGPGNDTIDGGPDDDTIDGGPGNDTIDGGDNDDELIGGSGNNALDGGAGDEDIVIYLGAMQVTVDLRTGKARVQHETATDGGNYLSLEDSVDSGTGDDTLANIENVKGTHGPDRIDGNKKANLLKGLDDADIINGHEGDDTIIPNRPMVVDGETPDDGVDVVDGGADSDTISYEGEAAANGVTIDLNTDSDAFVEAVIAMPDEDPPVEAVIAYIPATVTGGAVDWIKVVDEGTEDAPNVLSTIENLKGGAGVDILTGDTRANRIYGLAGGDTLRGEAADAETGSGDMLDGGAGADTLYGGPGGDTLIGGPDDDTLLAGGPGDDTYVVEVGDPVTVTETMGEGMDTLRYAVLADDPATDDVDESKLGTGPVTTPPNVETVLGTPNDDEITAVVGGATILGREGDDELNGGTGEGVDTLVGCTGENKLNGGGGNDIFGVFNDGTNADTIEDFTTGEGMAATDEIHLKGFEGATQDDVGFASVPVGDVARAAVQVDGVTVAIVNSSGSNEIEGVTAAPDADPPVEAKSKVQAIIDALGKDNASGLPVTRLVDFVVERCSSN